METPEETRWLHPPNWMLAVVLCLLFVAQAQGEEYFDKYDLIPNGKYVDMGVQPMAYPLAFISSAMQRDRLLREELKKLRLELRAFSFRKGNDIVNLMGEGKLEFAFLGDMPTVNTLMRTPTYIAGLGKRNFSSIVARNYSRIEELKGKRVAYSGGSSSHLVLLRGLESAGMAERDVTLVSMEPAQMPDALESGAVDAYSAWEPTPSISLARNPRNRAIYRGMSTDWVVLSRDLAETRPEVARLLVASYARAINWMRAAGQNATRVGRWVMADGEAFTGRKPDLPLNKAIEIARKDLLDVPGAPAVPSLLDGLPPLMREFDFLRQQRRIAADADTRRITEAFAYGGLRQVQSEPKKHQLFVYNYDQ
jgi:ABC-type nitrate/sulfonate/bicarbonate transport system substrate-binding protein